MKTILVLSKRLTPLIADFTGFQSDREYQTIDELAVIDFVQLQSELKKFII